jgi:hypothetical protein
VCCLGLGVECAEFDCEDCVGAGGCHVHGSLV